MRPGGDGGRSTGRVTPVLVLAVLASLTVITLDARQSDGGPVEPVRQAVGTVVGPMEAVAANVVAPFQELAGFVATNRGLRADVARLEAENSQLAGAVATEPLDRARLRQLDTLTRTAGDTGYSLVAARVVAMGPLQSFSRTVTIDAGTTSGIRADMTVLNGDGLVGRVVRATRTSATVLLLVDTESVVGGRLGSSLEIGFLRGRGVTSDRGRLDLDLVDTSVTPARGDVVVTWGSNDGVPYVAGIPIGRVLSVHSSPRQMAKQAVVEPFVDFTSLDVVGVVVPRSTSGDRPVIGPGQEKGATR